MQFKVPQFIEREAKIVGPLTFKQFAFIGGAGVLVFVLYSLIAYISLPVFIIAALIVVVVGFSFAFLKIEGHSMISLFLGLSSFLTSPRIFLWGRKKKSSPSLKIDSVPEKVDEPSSPSSDIKVFQQSKLKDLSSKIEIS